MARRYKKYNKQKLNAIIVVFVFGTIFTMTYALEPEIIRAKNRLEILC